MSKTDYIVLFRDGNTWIEFDDRWEATSAKGAIRAAMNGTSGNSAGGTVVAVPVRSWQPQPVKVETQQRLRIG